MHDRYRRLYGGWLPGSGFEAAQQTPLAVYFVNRHEGGIGQLGFAHGHDPGLGMEDAHLDGLPVPGKIIRETKDADH